MAFCSTITMVLPLVVLEVAQYLEYRVDEARLESDRGLVDQQHLRVHDQRAGDFEQAALTARQHLGRVLSARGEPRIFVEDPVGGAAWPTLRFIR